MYEERCARCGHLMPVHPLDPDPSPICYQCILELENLEDKEGASNDLDASDS